MFETVVPETFQRRSKRVFYETLPVSVAIHGMAIAGAISAALWNVTFPEASPRISVAYSLTTVPDPPPPPPPPPKAEAPKPEPAKPTPPPPPIVLQQIVAPTIIPDKIPDVVLPPPIPIPQPAVQPVATGGGDPNGSASGVAGGEVGGRIGGKVGGVAFPDDGRLHVALGENLPMKAVVQEYPHYPDEARKRHLEDQVIVRYVVGTDGRVKSVEILSHAKESFFDDAAVDAIKKWRFRPMIKDGKPVEVEHDLGVNFELVIR